MYVYIYIARWTRPQEQWYDYIMSKDLDMENCDSQEHMDERVKLAAESFSLSADVAM